MANPEHLAKLKAGVPAWNRWRRDHPDVRPDLSGADLSGADLSGSGLRMVRLSGEDLIGADFTYANLTDCNLSGANLSGALLTHTHLRDVDLHGADLHGAHFSMVDLRGAELTGANLYGIDLETGEILGGGSFFSSNLSGARFSKAQVGWTSFSHVDLSQARGLGSVVHHGPSSIGLDTILRSGGKIPARFLRGCGYDPLIQQILVGDNSSKTDAFYAMLAQGGGPLRLQSCFISYSTRDKAFVHRLQTALNEKGVDYWYAPEHGRWGEELKPQIDREIHRRDRVVLVCSQDSLNSDWVQWEIDHALAEEKKRGKKVIFPIMLDDALLKWDDPRASHILTVLAGDFRKSTRGPAFDAKLEKLLAGLEPADKTVSSGGSIMVSKRPNRKSRN